MKGDADVGSDAPSRALRSAPPDSGKTADEGITKAGAAAGCSGRARAECSGPAPLPAAPIR